MHYEDGDSTCCTYPINYIVSQAIGHKMGDVSYIEKVGFMQLGGRCVVLCCVALHCVVLNNGSSFKC